MRRLVFVLSLVLLFTFGCKKDSEKYIAIVNDSKIEREKFDVIVDKQIKQIEKMGHKITPDQKYDIQKRLLDRMVTVEILLQESKKAGTVVTEEEVTKRFAVVKGQYPRAEDFEKVLKENSITESEIREELRKSMIIDAFLKKQIGDKIQVDDAEIKKIYDEHKNRFNVPDQVKASHILMKTKAKQGTPEADKEGKEIKDKLGAIRQDIVEKKKDFAAAAKEFSECPSKDKGGDLGFFPREAMAPEFSKEAFSQKPGNISPPFKTQFGYHILMVTDKQAAHQKTYDEAKGEIREVLKNQKGGVQVREYLENIKKNAKVTSFLQEPAVPAPAPASTTPPPPAEPKKEVK